MNITHHSSVSGISLVLMTIISIATFANLQSTPWHALGVLVIIVLDVIMAWSLYYVFKPANKDIALLMSLMRIVYAAAFFSALSVFQDIDAFQAAWNMSLSLFGVHLVLLGYLGYTASYIPKWLGALVLIAGLGYIIDSVGILLGYEMSISLVTFIGEIILAVWLIVKRKTLTNAV